MRTLFAKLRVVFEERDRVMLPILLISVALKAALEVAGIASVVPFMSVASNPSIVHTNKWLNWAYTTGGFESEQGFLIATGVAVVILLVLANLLSVVTRYVQLRFSWGVAHRLACRLLGLYAARPYTFFLTHNSSQLGKQVLDEVRQFVAGVMMPATEFFARVVTTVSILALLIVADPRAVGVIIFVFGGLYVVIYASLRRTLDAMGEVRLQSVKERFKSASELLRGIKIVKVHHAEDQFLKRFQRASSRSAAVQVRYQILATVPRYGVEIIAFGTIVLLILYLLAQGIGEQLIPMISMYAFAGYRLLPSVQLIFASASSIRYHRPLVDELYEDLTWKEQLPEVPVSDELHFEEEIRLDEVGYTYEGGTYPALRDVSLRIRKGSSVGIVGSTGSGKSTLVDLIVGLLTPTSGEILIDDVVLDRGNVRRWQELIGYVPQDPFFFDDTVERNIAIGVRPNLIDGDRVRWAAGLAEIDRFIEDELPLQYKTSIEESGVRLSGGQRQRVGLARALYHQPSVLIMDEATSALDNITEHLITRSIREQLSDVTVVVVAHRLSAVKSCDYIFLLEDGQIINEGSYEHLMSESQLFRRLAQHSV